ncbi:MAG: hypothetical protein D3919_12230 [Candidatus Electrothrix sp. AW5]|nr:hypothetical protein [Candidatus Electrothrix gigas]
MSRTKELPSSNIGKYIHICGVLLALGTVIFAYIKHEGIWPYTTPYTTVQLFGDVRARGLDAEIGKTGAAQQGKTVAAAPPALAGRDSAQQVHSANSANTTDAAIVAVTTFWGRGTGFFIQKNFFITSRYLVDPDPKKLAAVEEEVIRKREILQTEEAKLQQYQERFNSMQYRGNIGNAKKTASRQKLDLLMREITEREKDLAALRLQQEQEEQRLTEQQQAQKDPVITVLLADGSEQQASLVQISRQDNLALLSVQNDAVDTVVDTVYSVLQPPPQGSLLRLGDTVVLPRGFAAQKTMTPGIFAGYRRVGIQNRMYLQIHAQPGQHTDNTGNPGNTNNTGGTPVLDTSGNVHAVVTKTVQDGKEIYFALPFARVLDAFAAALHEQEYQEPKRTELATKRQ